MAAGEGALMALPKDCAACTMYDKGKLCRRHSVAPGPEQYERAFWPEVDPGSRCSEGETERTWTRCGFCAHWHRPGGHGIDPGYYYGLPKEWWEKSGYCTHHAPHPMKRESRKMFPGVTHASEGCGDGEPVE